MLSNNPDVEITYFIQDERKEGGKYKTIKNKIRKIDSYNQAIVMQDDLKIPIKEIIDISSDIFRNIIF